MLRSRLIPCLLLKSGGLVKTTNFKSEKYVGDPVNAVRIFNEKLVDELIVLDIDSSLSKQEPDFSLVEKLAKECRMPFCYGGGIKNVTHAEKIISLGVEKVALSSIAFEEPQVVEKIANRIGKQSVVIVLDVKKKMFEKDYEVFIYNGNISTKKYLLESIKFFENLGVGEILINFIDYDGTKKGYPVDALKKIKEIINVPFTILGGAKSVTEMSSLAKIYGPIGLAAGSLFVFKGKYRAVLLNYPNYLEKINLLYEK